MTPKEALNNIWRDSYPKAREKWSADRFRKHWYIVQKSHRRTRRIEERRG